MVNRHFNNVQRTRPLAPQYDNEYIELWVSLVCFLCLVIFISKTAAMGRWVGRRHRDALARRPRGKPEPAVVLHRHGGQTASGREKVNVKLVHPHCEREQEAGPE